MIIHRGAPLHPALILSIFFCGGCTVPFEPSRNVSTGFFLKEVCESVGSAALDR